MNIMGFSFFDHKFMKKTDYESLKNHPGNSVIHCRIRFIFL